MMRYGLSFGELLLWAGNRGSNADFRAGGSDGGGGGIVPPQANVCIFNLKLGLGVDVRMEPGRGVNRTAWRESDRKSSAPNDALGAVDLHTVTRNFAQCLYFNVATPVSPSNSTAVSDESDSSESLVA